MEIKKYESAKHGEVLFYAEHKPENAKGRLPLLVHIHGAGTRGNDAKIVLDGEPFTEIRKGRRLDAIVVAPHCPTETWFEVFEVLLEFIEAQTKRTDVDASRVYLTGVSMGGYTAWQILISKPELFAAAMPICGGGMYWDAARLKNIPIWAFHGALDTSVLPEESIHMVRGINNAGGNAKITIYPNNGHDVWTDTFANDDVWTWLFSQKKG